MEEKKKAQLDAAPFAHAVSPLPHQLGPGPTRQKLYAALFRFPSAERSPSLRSLYHHRPPPPPKPATRRWRPPRAGPSRRHPRPPASSRRGFSFPYCFAVGEAGFVGRQALIPPLSAACAARSGFVCCARA